MPALSLGSRRLREALFSAVAVTTGDAYQFAVCACFDACTAVLLSGLIAVEYACLVQYVLHLLMQCGELFGVRSFALH
jgi:hypothetical protein